MFMVPSGGEYHAVAAVSCRHHAVHHIHAAVYGFEYVGWCSHSHEIAGAVGGQHFVHHVYHVVHHLGWLAYGKAAYSVAVGAQLGCVEGGFAAKVGIGAALHYGEVRLVVAVAGLCGFVVLPAAFEPALGEV